MSQEVATLAPAAGAGIGKLLADRLLSDPTFVQLMLDAVLNGLKATRSYWTGKGETAELITEPDSKTQLQAFALVMAHMEGEPIKRIIVQDLNKSADPMTALMRDPQLLESAKEFIAKADTWHKSGRAKKAPKPAQAVTEIE